ncbi:MAG: hypothetical protein KF729_36170 [Sandaracinaceae bacterium]|nr:hypothetical protein [Sandaracinaceae bacterium]
MTRRGLSLALAVLLGGCTAALPDFDDAGPGSDAGTDGGTDAGHDAGHDAGQVAGSDAGEDAGHDAGADAGQDAGVVPVVRQISVGSIHTCALVEPGGVFCWGADNRGQLGDGFTDGTFAQNRAEPQPVVTLSDVVSIHAGWGATCALDAAGAARCWGHNTQARFGDGTGSSTTPTPVSLMFAGTPEPLVEISHNESHLCARSATRVYCSGHNGQGQLGREGAGNARLTPVEGLPLERTPRSIAAGYSTTNGFTLLALDDGSVWCWGQNDDSECALPASDSVPPTEVPGLSRIVQVTAGANFACARDDVGDVFCWGSNHEGRTGNGTLGGPEVEVPTRVSLPVPIGWVGAEGGSVIAVTSDGAGVYGWGGNTQGLLGLGGADAQPSPRVLVMEAGARFEAAIGSSHACLIRRRPAMIDEVLCAGSNSNLQLGMRPAPDPSRFGVVPMFP